MLTLLLAGCGDGPAGTAAGSGSARPAATESAAARPAPSVRVPRLQRTGRPSEAAPVLDASQGWVVTPLGTTISVRSSPGGPVQEEMPTVRETGAPLTFLLDEDTGDGWFRVLLPVRPNGSTGWVEAGAVSVARAPYRLEMDTSGNQLRLFEGEDLLRTMPAASGTGDTPTPLGRFYLTELLEPTNPGYGPYAYGTSGFSEVLTSFGGGPGQVGLHGTDDASSIGRAASHGCIRLSDDDITYLAGLLPLGTPVEVR